MNDYFSIQSDHYAKFRPKYPEELFKFISGLCHHHHLAWDCGTGNGQTALSLSQYFTKIIATDISEKQIGNAFQKVNIIYRVEAAENCTIESSFVDLVTASAALHWFDKKEFFRQADRVLKSGGVLAVWSYAGCRISEDIDIILDDFAFEFLKDYWPLGARYNWQDGYRSLEFPYRLVQSPPFRIESEYTFNDLLSYLFTWSSVQEFIKAKAINPIDFISEKLAIQWGDLQVKKPVTWNLFMKCGYKP